MCGVAFTAFFLLFKRSWLAMAVQSVVYLTLSMIEFFKFATTGNHFVITDMLLADHTKSLTTFIPVSVSPWFVITLILLIGYIVCSFVLFPKAKIQLKKQLTGAGACLGFLCCMLFVPSFSMPVYSFFTIDNQGSENMFRLNEKYENNSFLAFFVETTTEAVNVKLKKPNGYSEKAVAKILENSENTPASSDWKKPNVIVIMSEAFADFRVFEELGLKTSSYDNFDYIASKGKSAVAVVPTFGYRTIRTEFELNLGLPVLSLGDHPLPHQLVENKTVSLADTYKSHGYKTYFMHPYERSFYNRENIYELLGFENLVFEDDLTVDVEYHDKFVSDAALFKQAVQTIKNSEEPVYIHATTMQNHQPYAYPYPDEFESYLVGIEKSGMALRELVEELEISDEPTIILYVGDHFPSFNNLEGESIYRMLNVNSDNCEIAYEQKYIMWSNYDVDFSAMPSEKISTFYLPYVLQKVTGAPRDKFTNKMLEIMEDTPVYASNSDSLPNVELDILVYFRVIDNE
jgi:phosphoglycerol transferase MdoB-like AlkP superfamily enzyme